MVKAGDHGEEVPLNVLHAGDVFGVTFGGGDGYGIGGDGVIFDADVLDVGLRADPKRTAELRSRGIVANPEDLGIRRTDAHRNLLAARSIDDLVAWSGGLYQPPAKFRSW